MPKYGQTHKVSNFVGRTLARREARFAHSVINLLANIDEVQRTNSFVTLAVHAGGALRLFYKGDWILSLYPALDHLKLYTNIRELQSELDKLRSRHVKRVDIDTNKNRYSYWRVGDDNFDAVMRSLERLESNPAPTVDVGDHPRTFPGEVREAALQLFQANGSICPGVGRIAHKVTEGFEFDHIYPHAKGGSNSALNIQVLCQECNRRKRATAVGNPAKI